MKTWKPKKLFVLLCTLTVLLTLVIWTVWGNTALMVNTTIVSSNRIPAGFSGYRIVQVSDLHNAEFGTGNIKLLQIISENAPDIIVITGDLVDMNHTNIDVALDFAKNAINISSSGGYTIVPTAITYCATKFYVSTFTEGLAWELIESGATMRAKVLAPAATQTEFGKKANNVEQYDYDNPPAISDETISIDE